MPNRSFHGPTVEALRLARGYRQVQLARLSGVSAGYLREIEKGRVRPSLVVINRLAAALGVTPEDLTARQNSTGSAA